MTNCSLEERIFRKPCFSPKKKKNKQFIEEFFHRKALFFIKEKVFNSVLRQAPSFGRQTIVIVC